MMLGTAIVNFATSGDKTVVAAPASGFKIRVLGYALWADGTVNVQFWDGASSNNLPLTGLLNMTVGLHEELPQSPRDEGYSEGWFDCSAGNALILNLSTSVQVSGRVSYELMPV